MVPASVLHCLYTWKLPIVMNMCKNTSEAKEKITNKQEVQVITDLLWPEPSYVHDCFVYRFCTSDARLNILKVTV